MGKVAYSASKKQFIQDCIDNSFLKKMTAGAARNGIGGATAEVNSWQNNSEKIRNLLDASDLPDDLYVAFEYKCNNGGRVDCIFFGNGDDKKAHIVIFELKQWSNRYVDIVFTDVFKVWAMVTKGCYKTVSHPSAQAANYISHIQRFNSYSNEPTVAMNGYAYCYNYDSQGTPHVLFDERYRPFTDQCPIRGQDHVRLLAGNLHSLLCNGNGKQIFDNFLACREQPTAKLMEAVASMFRGDSTFTLIDEQLTSSNYIFGMVGQSVKAKENSKQVLIVKGGPGTGKTVIALHVLAELAAKYPNLKTFFTSRSKALRNSLREQLEKNAIKSNQGSAADLISNIYSFRPSNYKENELDVVLVDEAHRIANSANYMKTGKNEKTFLSMLLSILYTSKICVFFIDDQQCVSSKEIGSSSVIRETAENYARLIESACGQFRNELEENDKKFLKLRQDKENLLQKSGSGADKNVSKQLDRINRKIEECEAFAKREHELDDIKSSVEQVEVTFIELNSQFRCSGSDSYLDWVSEVLYSGKQPEEITFNPGKDYLFGICSSPKELEEKIRELNKPNDNPKQIARLAAGYCWKWSDKLQSNGDLYPDVQIGNWSMPWETNNVQAQGNFAHKYAPSADLWVSHPMGINQVGCIFSAQGFEVDYIGVIFGPDIKYDEAEKKIVAVPGLTHGVGRADCEIYVKNIYRVLLTRGMKGCFIYCCDKALEDFFWRSISAR